MESPAPLSAYKVGLIADTTRYCHRFNSSLDGPLAGQSIPHLHVHILPRRVGDFADNDDVYRELQTHDRQTSGWRSEQEMVEEATLFRNAIKTC